MADQILFAMFIHVIWIVVLYSLLTLFRAPSVWGLFQSGSGSNPFATLEPKVSANLSNQFEWPLVFYAICIILIATPEYINSTQVWLAWVFLIGRFLHSAVQILTNNIRLRGAVFTINFLAVFGMWSIYLIAVLKYGNT